MSEKRLSVISAVVGTVFIFFSMNPFIMWIVWPVLINIPVYFAVLLITIVLANYDKLKINYNKLIYLLVLFLFMLHIGTPITGGPGWEIGKLLSFSGVFFILLFKDVILYKIFHQLRLVMKFFCWFSLIIFLLILIGIELPYYKIPAFTLVMNNSYGGEAFYKLYGFVVSSTNTVYNFNGFNVSRICGPFQEPGHLAIYLGIILFFEKLIIKKKSTIFIVTGILTFSPNFFIFIGLFFLHDLLYKSSRMKVLKYITIFLFVILIFFSNNIQYELLYLIVGRNFEDTGFDILAVLDNRAGKQALYYYESFIQTSDVWFGKGISNLEQYGVLSDYRGMIFKFGLIGLILSIFASIRILSFSYRIKDKLIIIILIPMIYLQRSWMFESIFIYSFLIIGLISFKHHEIRKLDSKI